MAKKVKFNIQIVKSRGKWFVWWWDQIENTFWDYPTFKGFTYGNMEYKDQKLNVKIGPLICHPDIQLEEKYSIQNQISMLEGRINSTNEDVEIHRDSINELMVWNLFFYSLLYKLYFKVLKWNIWDIMKKLFSLQIDVSKRALKTELKKMENKSFSAINEVPTADIQNQISMLEGRINSTNEDLEIQSDNINEIMVRHLFFYSILYKL